MDITEKNIYDILPLRAGSRGLSVFTRIADILFTSVANRINYRDGYYYLAIPELDFHTDHLQAPLKL
jgi:hypothetical protein